MSVPLLANYGKSLRKLPINHPSRLATNRMDSFRAANETPQLLDNSPRFYQKTMRLAMKVPWRQKVRSTLQKHFASRASNLRHDQEMAANMLTYSTAKFTSSERNTFKTCENSFPARRNNGKRIPVERFLPPAAATHCRNNEIAFLSAALVIFQLVYTHHHRTDQTRPR